MNPVVPPTAPAQPRLDLRHPGDTGPHLVQFDVSLATLLKLVLVFASLWLLWKLAPILLVLVVALLISWRSFILAGSSERLNALLSGGSLWHLR